VVSETDIELGFQKIMNIGVDVNGKIIKLMNETNFEAGGQLVGHFILHGMTKELNYMIFQMPPQFWLSTYKTRFWLHLAASNSQLGALKRY